MCHSPVCFVSGLLSWPRWGKVVSDKAKWGCTNYRIGLSESFIPEPGKNHRTTGLGTHRKPHQGQDSTDHLAPVDLILTGSFSLWYHFQLESCVQQPSTCLGIFLSHCKDTQISNLNAQNWSITTMYTCGGPGPFFPEKCPPSTNGFLV